MSEGISIEEACRNRVLTAEDFDRLCKADSTLTYVWLIGGLLVAILIATVVLHKKQAKK